MEINMHTMKMIATGIPKKIIKLLRRVSKLIKSKLLHLPNYYLMRIRCKFASSEEEKQKIFENYWKKYNPIGFKWKILAKQSISVRDIVLAQYNNNICHDFRFFDLIVRLCAIDEYMGKNSYGFELYNKMQRLSRNGGV